LCDSEGNYLLEGWNIHSNPLCKDVRKKGQLKRCIEECNAYTNEVFSKHKTSAIMSCWRGVKEVFVPVYYNDMHFLTVIGGCFKGEVSEGEKLSAQMRKVHDALPVLTEEMANTLSRVLYGAGHLIFKLVDDLRASEAGVGGRASTVARFIHHNASRPDCRIKNLAETLYLSPTRASHVVKEIFGISFQELIINERIARAKKLLSSSDMRLAEVALAVGIPNVYHFSRLFKRETGFSPGRFKRQANKNFEKEGETH
jgi:AraC-like DNA-binding protein